MFIEFVKGFLKEFPGIVCHYNSEERTIIGLENQQISNRNKTKVENTV